MAEQDAQDLHGQPVIVLTHAGVPISLGRIRVTMPTKSAFAPRVEVVFETETMACAIGIPPERIALLRASYNGQEYRHRLPEGDKLWLPRTSEDETSARNVASSAARLKPIPPPGSSARPWKP